jgi:hypothetical protein
MPSKTTISNSMMSIVQNYFLFKEFTHMNIKLNVLSAAILAGFSTAALSDVPPPVPEMYETGPSSLQFQNLGLSDAERAGYSLAEGIMQMAEATVLAKASCSAAAGTYDIVELFASGDAHDPEANTTTVLSPGGSFTLEADLDPNDAFRGQTMTITSVDPGKLAGTGLKEFSNAVSWNAAGTMMVAEGSVKAKGASNLYDLFQLKIIKDFYRDSVALSSGNIRAQVPVIYDWGLQSVSKLGYPLNKYWQRSKSLRDDGIEGYTHFVKDRLVGSGPCRIELLTTGSNNADFFQQSGTLTISTVKPEVDAGF